MSDDLYPNIQPKEGIDALAPVRDASLAIPTPAPTPTPTLQEAIRPEPPMRPVDAVRPPTTSIPLDAAMPRVFPKTISPTSSVLDDKMPEIPRIRTYADDVKNAIVDQQESATSMALAEQRRRERDKRIDDVAASNPRNMALVVAAIVLILTSIGAIVYFASQVKKVDETPQTPTAVTNKLIIDYDNALSLDVTDATRKQVETTISTTLTQAFAPGSITNVRFADGSSPLDFDQWSRRIRSQIPETFVRTVKPNFLFGVYALEQKQPFLLLEVVSFEQAYAGMLEWERTIPWDLQNIVYTRPPVAPAPVATSTQQTGTSTPTPVPTAPRQDKGFADLVIGNRDARIYQDADGKTLFFYTFIDNTTILIADEDRVLTEVVRRLERARFAR